MAQPAMTSERKRSTIMVMKTTAISPNTMSISAVRDIRSSFRFPVYAIDALFVFSSVNGLLIHGKSRFLKCF